MFKKIFFVFLFFLSLSVTFANDYFNVSMDSFLTGGAKIYVKTKLDDILSMKMFIGDKELLKGTKEKSIFTFIVPNNLNISSLNPNIYFKFKPLNKKEETIFYDKTFPKFYGLDFVKILGGEKVRVIGNFTGSCKLIVGKDEKWSLSLKDNGYYVTIPKLLNKAVKGGYINCDGLSSNYIDFYIPASPTLLYVISKNKKPIQPGDTLILKGENIKLSYDDDIKLYLNGEEISYKLVDSNTLEFKLPYENLINSDLYLTRNNFKSNIIKIIAVKKPIIKKVTLVDKGNNIYVRLIGNFDFDLGKINVKYGNKNLSIINTGYIDNSLQYIDVEYSNITFDKNGKSFTCSYFFSPDYFYLTIDGVNSNKYFYSPSSDLYIVHIDKPYCAADDLCYIDIKLNKNVNSKMLVLLNNKKVNYSVLGSDMRIITDKLVVKGYIQFVNTNCIETEKYFYDYTDSFKPVINSIESKSYFKPGSWFIIYGNNFVNPVLKMDGKVNFNPDIVNNIEFGNSIEGTIKYGVEEGTNVKVRVSNKFGHSNGAFFVIGGDVIKYMGAPIIRNVEYINGGEANQNIKILGKNFSEKCNDNLIYLNDYIVYPSSCERTSLIFKIPANIMFDNISVEVNGNKSNKYYLNTTLGGNIDEKNFSIDGTNEDLLVDVSKNNVKKRFSFKINNTITDLYLKEIEFFIPDVDFLPAYNFTLYINKNNKKYFWSQLEKKVLATSEKNIGYIEKVDSGYKLIFKDIYIPFSANPIEANVEFYLSSFKDNFSIKFLPQKIYYNKIFGDDISLAFDIQNSFEKNYKLILPYYTCFDSDDNFRNCSLLLRGEKIVYEGNKDENTENSGNVSSTTTTKNVTTNTTSTKKLTKQEKIAQRLTLEKMQLLNNLIKKFIIKMKDKYWSNKEKMKYIIEMYRGYKQMLANTLNDFDKKVEYVNGLIYFAKNYYLFYKN